MNKIKRNHAGPLFIFIFALTLISSPLAAAAANIDCPGCNKSIDESNSSCPYCLSEIKASKAPKTQARPNENAGNDRPDYNSAPASNPQTAQRGPNERLLAEAEVQARLSEIIDRMQSPDQKVRIDNLKRETPNANKFVATGMAYSKSCTPMRTVSKILENMASDPSIQNPYLKRAAKVNINEPTVVTFTITMKMLPEFIKKSRLKPVEFAFVVPKAGNKNSPDDVFNVKILKKIADSEDVVYDSQHKAGEKVLLTVVPSGGMSLLVLIDGKKIYEKKY